MSIRWPFVLFDMDGTLIDSAEMVTRRYAETFEFFGIEVPGKEELHTLVGPSAVMSMTKYLGAERADAGIAHYRVLAKRDGLSGLDPFPGIPEMIHTLHSHGVRLAVATSKPEIEAERILAHVGLDHLFEAVSGASDALGINSKPDVMKRAIERLSPPSLSHVVMVGDRVFDVEGAAECGVESIFVSWGGADLNEAGQSIAITHNPAELETLILGK